MKTLRCGGGGPSETSGPFAPSCTRTSVAASFGRGLRRFTSFSLRSTAAHLTRKTPLQCRLVDGDRRSAPAQRASRASLVEPVLAQSSFNLAFLRSGGPPELHGVTALTHSCLSLVSARPRFMREPSCPNCARILRASARVLPMVDRRKHPALPADIAPRRRFRYLSRLCGRTKARRAGMDESGMAGTVADPAGGPAAAARA